ncbi:hypothetical protein ACIBK1_33200 [Microbispora rosea]|uniref:hypothetical protein n=1 Tax=Microbispora rosea TaxID=58117 RepID=UPI00379E40B5
MNDEDHPHTHSFTQLLDSLQRQGHALLVGSAEEDLVVAFIRDLDSYNEGGDQGRYPTTRRWPPCAART